MHQDHQGARIAYTYLCQLGLDFAPNALPDHATAVGDGPALTFQCLYNGHSQNGRRQIGIVLAHFVKRGGEHFVSPRFHIDVIIEGDSHGRAYAASYTLQRRYVRAAASPAAWAELQDRLQNWLAHLLDSGYAFRDRDLRQPLRKG